MNAGAADEVEILHQYLSALTHDIGGAVTVISGFANMLEEESAAVDHIRSAVGQLGDQLVALQAVRDLLGHEAEPLPISVGEAVDGAVADSDCPAESTDVSAISTDLSIVADPFLIRSALVPVFDNTFRYRRGDEAPAVIVRAAIEGERLVVVVEDDGPGMPDHTRERAVRLFYRGVPSSVAPGIGAGLAIAYAAVRRLGGTLRLESVEGQGTTVTISCPVQPGGDER